MSNSFPVKVTSRLLSSMSGACLAFKEECADTIKLCLESPEQYSSATSIFMQCLHRASARKGYKCCGVERCPIASRQAQYKGFRGSRLPQIVHHRLRLSLSICGRICFCARREVLQSAGSCVRLARRWARRRKARSRSYSGSTPRFYLGTRYYLVADLVTAKILSCFPS